MLAIKFFKQMKTETLLGIWNDPLPSHFKNCIFKKETSFSLSNRRYVSTLGRSGQSQRSQDKKEKKLPFFISMLGGAVLLGSGVAYASSEEHEPTISNQDIQKKLEKSGTVLDFSDCTVSDGDLVKLSNWLKLKQHQFLRVNWGRALPTNNTALTSIEESLRSNQEAFEERPTPYLCAKFCSLSYSNKHALGLEPTAWDGLLQLDLGMPVKKCTLPTDWKILDYEDSVKEDGYFGVAFVNDKTGHIILAHRGTDAYFRDLQTDVIGVVGGVVEAQQLSAVRFTRRVLDSAEAKKYRLGIVGHSLGGWLAQLTASLCVSKGHEDVYSMTLDTPGAQQMLENYFEGHHMVSMARLDEDRLDFTNYLSLPNIVNTCNTQTGDLFHIVPNLSPGSFSSMDRLKFWAIKKVMPSAEYVLKTHSQNAQLAQFDSKKGMPKRVYKVMSWPQIEKMGRRYPEFFDLARKNMCKFPETGHLSDLEQYLVKHIACYNVTEAKNNEISLRHFSDATIAWLEQVNKKIKENPQFLKELETKLGIANSEMQRLLNFKIEEGFLKVQGDMPAWEFKNHLARLLKTYPELFSLALDPEFPIRLEELDVFLSNQKKELISSCEDIIPTRLYLYDPAEKEEIADHMLKKQELVAKISRRQEWFSSFERHKDSPAASHWTQIVQDQIAQLKIISGIQDVLINYKKREFDKARQCADEVLALMESYQQQQLKTDLQLPRIRASMFSLKAKIDRSIWKKEEDLKNSEKNYLNSLDEELGLPRVASLWSNYGALLNNWGEWLFWEGREEEAIEKHRQALEKHKKAHELSVQDWIFCQPNKNLVIKHGREKALEMFNKWKNNDIKRDYGRAIYLLARAEYDVSKKTSKNKEIFQNKLKEALLLFATEETDPKKIPAVTHLFRGIILQDMEKYQEAFECYDLGLKNRPRHVTLLYRRGFANFELQNMDAAKKDAEASKERFIERGIYTPEDEYRFGLVRKLLRLIKEK
ncbi:lipase family protein [Candidatus Neptunochlamydia vexilliferae]|uniref:Fungal lipase-type domain-containing protein n=1 Tax=Candidatus Neptunichlamydia vexilliferae TaxID=1651774 RepID=A0ABS0AYP6_9BACT|nr:Mbeg1-like protein [Candidatus Neptunochlamydia vexilliferae]MBF5059085.1 hypothetical protein [Candidatus Neptunochlamydia vexilliferae]